MHAHVSTHSSDCDGNYFRQYTLQAGDGQDFYDFSREVVGLYAPTEGTMTFTRDGFEFDAPHDEGYRYGDVEWCYKAACRND